MAEIDTPKRILVVDDEVSMRDLISTALDFIGFDVRTAADGLDALNTAARFAPDLIVLDVNMPRMDGWECCRRMRESGNHTPVIFLTARDETDDTITGFEVGGDDYVTKPFHLPELIARVNAVLKRAPNPVAGGEAPDRLSCGGLVIEQSTYRVWRDSERVELSPTEYRLLRYLLINAGVVVSKAQILDAVWEYDFDGDASVVETYMSTLRRKVDRAEHRLIHTVRGFGYVIRADEP